MCHHLRHIAARTRTQAPVVPTQAHILAVRPAVRPTVRRAAVVPAIHGTVSRVLTRVKVTAAVRCLPCTMRASAESPHSIELPVIEAKLVNVSLLMHCQYLFSFSVSNPDWPISLCFPFLIFLFHFDSHLFGLETYSSL
jgi:hypothetical protein